MHRNTCPHCHARGTVQRPSRLWLLAVAAAWGFLFLAVLGASLIGPFVLAVGPVLALSGACLLSFVHTRASEPATCDECGKIVPDASTEPRVPAAASPAEHVTPAHAA